MIKLKSLEFLGLSHRIPGEIKHAVYRLEISTLFPEKFKLEITLSMQMIELMTQGTKNKLKCVTGAISVNLQQRPLKLSRLIVLQ